MYHIQTGDNKDAEWKDASIIYEDWETNDAILMAEKILHRDNKEARVIRRSISNQINIIASRLFTNKI